MNQSLKIQRSFSKSSGHYDEYSLLHRSIADELFLHIPKELNPQKVLDIGCGTGYLTGQLKIRWPQARIVGLDFALGMIEKARATHQGVDWILADSVCLPFTEHHFDVVVSNLSYQWAEDLVKAIAEIRRVLAPGAVFAATIFGQQTCNELLDLLQEVAGIKTKRLPAQATVQEAMDRNGFRNVELSTVRNTIEFNDVYALLSWLKSIGANALSYEGFLGKDALAKAAVKYQERFPLDKGIAATFEVISIYAKK